MTQIKANQLKRDMFVLYKNAPHMVLKCEFYFPGKGSAFARTRLKNVKTGNVYDYTYKSSESVEVVEVETTELQYLYQDGTTYHFMNPQTFEQHEVAEWEGEIFTSGSENVLSLLRRGDYWSEIPAQGDGESDRGGECGRRKQCQRAEKDSKNREWGRGIGAAICETGRDDYCGYHYR